MEQAIGFVTGPLEIVPALILIAASFFTSALTAAFGVGGGVAMMALMAMFMPVLALIPVHGAVQLGSNTGRAWHQRLHIDASVVTPFVIGTLIGATAGAIFVVQLPDALLRILLAGFILWVLWAPIPGIARIGHAGIAIGSTITAFLTMFLGATGPLVAALFAQLFPDDRRAFIATNAAGMAFQHFIKIIVFALAGFAFAQWLPLIGLMIATGYLGTIYGSRLLDHLPEKQFRFWFRIAVSVLAADMMRRGILAHL